jgi:hypothetical protein
MQEQIHSNANIENMLIGVLAFPLRLPIKQQELSLLKVLPERILSIQDADGFIVLILIVLSCLLKRDFSRIDEVANQLNDFALDSTHKFASQHTKRSVQNALNLLMYAKSCAEASTQAELASDLVHAVNNYDDMLHNVEIMRLFHRTVTRKGPIAIAKDASILRSLRLSRHRYFYLRPEAATLFGALSSMSRIEDLIISESIFSDGDASGCLFYDDVASIISNDLTTMFDQSLFHSKDIYQCISAGRSGTYYLRTLLVGNSVNLYPIHNLVSLPTHGLRSIVANIGSSMADTKQTSCFTLTGCCYDWMVSLTAEYLTTILAEILLSIEKGYRPVIVNHWLVPFAPIFKRVFPALSFLTLVRKREDLIFSMKKKQQIIGNPLPLHLIKSRRPLDDLLRDVDACGEWIDWHLSTTTAISSYLQSEYPASFLGTLSLTPPTCRDIDRINSIFNLSINPNDALALPRLNEKRAYA